jgi:SAM-dependent methyltransferase
MSTYQKLEQLFRDHYSLANLRHISPSQLQAGLLARIGQIDFAIEGYLDAAPQRDLSLKFHWGHNHNFGEGFALEGRMGNRHLELMAEYIDHWGFDGELQGKKVLDIGVWTGGSSLLLVALGADVVALEEVVKYAECVNYLAFAFGVEKQLRCVAKSLYDFLPQVPDHFDLVLYAGVLYHVTDPLLSLRLIFSCLKNGGQVFIETMGIESNESCCRYEGPALIHSGSREERNRGGWNYFVPSAPCLESWCRDAGFQEVQVGGCIQSRISGRATRRHFQDFCRAGISITSSR